MRWKKNEIYNLLFKPIDGIGISIFRIIFGFSTAFETFFQVRSGYYTRYLDIGIAYYYPGFSWLPQMPLEWVNPFFYIIAFLGLLVAMGLFYRVAIVLYFILFSYSFLMNPMIYNNHWYLNSLIALLFIWIPAHKYLSIDALIYNLKEKLSFQWWHLAVLKFQIGIVYIFAGISKINPDWLRGEPLTTWQRLTTL